MSETPQAATPPQAAPPRPATPGPSARPVQHNPENEPARTVPMHHTVPIHARPNVWRWTAKDKAGNAVEFAPGMTSMTFRGPTTPADAKMLAELYLVNARNEAMRAGYDDPGYTLDKDSLKPIDTTAPLTPETIGAWRPVGAAVPLTLGVGLTPPKDEPQA